MFRLSQQLKRGLTLVETLVAISILLVGVIGPLNIAARGIADGIFARNQLTANYLAQEAMEIVVNKRYALARRAQYIPPTSPNTIFDNNYVDTQFTACAGTALPNTCWVDAKAGTINSPCNSASFGECKLIYNTVSGVYQQPGNATGGDIGPTFTRKVQMVHIANSPELKVVVTVEWYNKSTFKTLILVGHLYSQG